MTGRMTAPAIRTNYKLGEEEKKVGKVANIF